MWHETPSAVSVSVHRARDEQLCDPCERFVARLQGQMTIAAPAEMVVVEQFALPAPLYWSLVGKADAMRQTVTEYLVHLAHQQPITSPPPPRRRPPMKHYERVDELLRSGFTDAEVLRQVECSADEIRNRRRALKLPSAAQIRHNIVDAYTTRLAAEGMVDREIANYITPLVKFPVSAGYVSERRQARRIPAGSRIRKKEKNG